MVVLNDLRNYYYLMKEINWNNRKDFIIFLCGSKEESIKIVLV
jgi:hypothetical protein